MLQYLTQPETRYSIPEQCQMVIEGGCEWVQLRLHDSDAGRIREICEELIPLCKETKTTLILEDNPELARELGIHGFHISLASGIDAIRLRTDYGPEAIIGVEVDNVDQIMSLKGADIDYVTLSPRLSDEQRVEICSRAAMLGNELPIVFEGEYKIDDAPRLLLMGASGICTGRFIVEAAVPTMYCADFIAALKARR